MEQSFEEFSVHVAPADGAAVLRVSGEIDLATAPLLAEHLALVRHDDVGDVILDLADVDFIDSTALRVLVAEHQRLDASGRRLMIANASTVVVRVLDLSGLATMFTAPEPAAD